MMFYFLYALRTTLVLPTKGGLLCPHLGTNNGRKPERVGILNLRKQLNRIYNILCSDLEKSVLPGNEPANLSANCEFRRAQTVFAKTGVGVLLARRTADELSFV
jgi:hypothetical protein